MSIEEVIKLNTALGVIENKKNFIPNFSGTEVYKRESFLGHFWAYIYLFLDFFAREEKYANAAFKRYFHTIRKISQTALNEIVKISSQYGELKQHGGEEFQNLKEKIIATSEALSTLIQVEKNTKIRERISALQRKSKEFNVREYNKRKFQMEEVDIIDFSNVQINAVEKLGQIYSFVVLEEITQFPVPQSAIQKFIGSSSSLLKQDQEHLQRWIRAVNIHRSSISASLVRQAFSLIFPEGVEKVEQKLGSSLDVFRNPGGGKQKRVVRYPTVEETKVTQLCFSAFNELHVRQCVVANAPQKMRLIGSGASFTALRDAYLENRNKSTWIPLLEVFSPENSVESSIIIERPKETLDAISWTATAENRAIITFAATLVQRLIASGKTSQFLDPKNFCICLDGSIKALRPIILEDTGTYKDYLTFFQKLARDNFYVFQECMVQSGLKTHKISQFYLHITRTCFGQEKSPANIDTVAETFKISDQKVIEEARSIFQALMSMREDIMGEFRSELNASGFVLDLEEEEKSSFFTLLENVVTEAMIDFHIEIGASIIYWPYVDLKGYIRAKFPKLKNLNEAVQ